MYQAKNSGGNCFAFAPDLEGSGDSVLQPQ
jgi:hypothetical protein